MLLVQDFFQTQIKSCTASLSPNQWSLISALAFAIIGIISISCGMGKVAPPSGNLSLIVVGSAFLTPVPILLIVFVKNHLAKKLPQANFEIIELPPQVDFRTITPSNFDGIFYTLSPEESHIRDMGDVTIKKKI